MATIKKKTNVVVPPVVEGETFASLQIAKNLDTQISIEEKLRLLYKLQQTDTRIDKLVLLRGELPLEVADLEDEVAGMETRSANLAKDIASTKEYIAQKKQDVINAKSLIEKYEQQCKNVKNNREYDSLTKEIEYQDLDRQVSEKNIADSTLALNEKQQQFEELANTIAAKKENLEIKKGELDSIIEETRIQEEELLKESGKIAEKLDSRTLNAYNKVRSNAHNHLAVVTVSRDSCGGCFNKIPAQKILDINASKKIIVCEYCGRILVKPEIEGEVPQQEETEE